MVLTSIGYRSKPIEGVAFDTARGVVVHRCASHCSRSHQRHKHVQNRLLYHVKGMCHVKGNTES